MSVPPKGLPAPALRVVDVGRGLAEEIASRMDDALATEAALDASVECLIEVQRLLDRFYELLVRTNPDVPVQCRRGCSACCSQMVFGVSPIEIEVIGRQLRHEGRAEVVLEALERRVELYDRVRTETPRRFGESADDHVERAAIEFLVKDVPCTLLADDGSCSVHPLRPYSCRRFFSLSDPSLCRGRGVCDAAYRGFMFEPLADLDARLVRLSEAAAFDPETDELDRGLLRWLRYRSPRAT